MPLTVSLISLIAEPQVYAGKRVFVGGYLVRSFECSTLYVHKEDYEQYVLGHNGVLVDLGENDGGEPEGYVWVDGIFDPERTMCSQGVIRSITRVEPMGRRQRDRDAR